MQPPIHAFAPFAEALRPLLAAEFPGREIVCWRTPEQFAAGIGEAEFLFVYQPPREYWARAAKLRLLHCIGAGVDDVLPAEGLPAQVTVTNARGLSAEPMAEFALALILAARNLLPAYWDKQRARQWERQFPGKVRAATLGIVGLGEIGRAIAHKARLLGMRVLGLRRTAESATAGAAESHVESVYPPQQLHTLLAASDVVLLLLPLTAETRGSFGAAEFAAMQKSAYLINLSRGGIVDETAMVNSLQNESIAGVISDVFAQEPLPEESPLWQTPNLWITPHIAGGFDGFLSGACAIYADNVRRMERGEKPRTPVSRKLGY